MKGERAVLSISTSSIQASETRRMGDLGHKHHSNTAIERTPTETGAVLLLRSRRCFDVYAVLRPDSDQESDIRLKLFKLYCCFPEKSVKASRHTNYGVSRGVPANDFEIVSLSPHQKALQTSGTCQQSIAIDCWGIRWSASHESIVPLTFRCLGKIIAIVSRRDQWSGRRAAGS